MRLRSIQPETNDFLVGDCRNRESRKATKLVVFRFLPVCLALLFSLLVLVWLTAFRPLPGGSMEERELRERQISSVGGAQSVSPENPALTISSVFTKEVHYWATDILAWSEQFSLDPNLIAVVMQIESCGHPQIRSSAGALGLFQVMPFHFDDEESALDPATNASRGLAYLSKAMEISGENPKLALAGYNGGHSVILWDPGIWPEETSRYVYWGTGILEDIRSGHYQSPRLMEWLSNGGSGLCNQAANALDL